MRVTAKLFAILRERSGVSTVNLDLPAESTVATAVEKLTATHPAIAPHLAKSAFAVNRAYSSRDSVLHDGDELAIIPPVSGG